MSRLENIRSHWDDATDALRIGNANRRPFLPWGFLPMVGLCATAVFALVHFSTQIVQNTAKQSAQEALSAIGANWATVSASGQWITIEGEAPTGEMAKAATRAVRAAKDRTPLGFHARPVTRINNLATIKPRASVIAPTDISKRHDWTYSLDRGVMTLAGQVPDQMMRERLVSAAKLRLDPPAFTSIEDQLMITGHPSEPGFEATAMRGINTLSRCDVGIASLTEAVFALSCEAEPDRLDEINMLASAPLEFGTSGRVDVFSAAQAEACDRSLMDLLETARIEFASSSAVISDVSNSLLDQVRDAATQCPATLMIEGHTDSSGLPETNETLSLERARAVRSALVERGIAADRLKATGFGARQPVGSNNTAPGRARNRRIEIKVARTNDRASDR